MLLKDQAPPAFTIGRGSRDNIIRKDRDLVNVSPFSYNKTFVDRKRATSFSMGGKLQSSFETRRNVPSPSAYNPVTTFTKMHAPTYKIGTSHRDSSFGRNIVPAPGHYEMKSKAFESLERPRFHMGLKIVFDDTKKFIHSLPGPGTHEPTHYVTKNNSPTYSMGVKFSSNKDTGLWSPGPG